MHAAIRNSVLLRVCYSRDGSFIVAGFDTGFIHIVSTDTLQDLHVGRNTSSSVTMLACSTTGDQVCFSSSMYRL